MEPTSDNQLDRGNPEIIVSGRIVVILSMILLSVFLLIGSFVSIVSTEINCTRSLLCTECVLTRKASTFQMTPIKIIDPVLVDVIGGSNRKYRQGGLYWAKIRVKNDSSTINLTSGYDYNQVQSVAHNLYGFLLSSKESSFSMRIP
jgi:hypothetical protein